VSFLYQISLCRSTPKLAPIVRPNQKYYLTTKHTKATKVSDIDISELRALRDLRGKYCLFIFGCGSAALCPSWRTRNQRDWHASHAISL